MLRLRVDRRLLTCGQFAGMCIACLRLIGISAIHSQGLEKLPFDVPETTRSMVLFKCPQDAHRRSRTISPVVVRVCATRGSGPPHESHFNPPPGNWNSRCSPTANPSRQCKGSDLFLRSSIAIQLASQNRGSHKTPDEGVPPVIVTPDSLCPDD